jgi:hypothetical protein
LLAFSCECTFRGCDVKVSLTLDEYREIRTVPTHFVVALGHWLPSVEKVVRETPRYQVVEKVGTAAVVARKLASGDHRATAYASFDELSREVESRAEHVRARGPDDAAALWSALRRAEQAGAPIGELELDGDLLIEGARLRGLLALCDRDFGERAPELRAIVGRILAPMPRRT